MICPDCSANGNVVTCTRCQGTGAVPDEMAEWIAEGRKMRDARVNGIPYRTVRDEAKRRGMTATELSAMEMGRVKPVPETKEDSTCTRT